MLPIAKLIALLIRDRITNLTAKELNKNKIGVLNLTPKFVPAFNRQRPYMHIIQATGIGALQLENAKYSEKAERQL